MVALNGPVAKPHVAPSKRNAARGGAVGCAADEMAWADVAMGRPLAPITYSTRLPFHPPRSLLYICARQSSVPAGRRRGGPRAGSGRWRATRNRRRWSNVAAIADAGAPLAARGAPTGAPAGTPTEVLRACHRQQRGNQQRGGGHRGGPSHLHVLERGGGGAGQSFPRGDVAAEKRCAPVSHLPETAGNWN